jgi:hypothetical protein
MNLTRQSLAPVAIQDAKNHVVSVDLASLLVRLFLFETTIIRSVWLEDIEQLVTPFGADGLIQLFRQNAIKVHCDSYTVGETGRARADLNFADNNKRLPLNSYSYSVILVKDQDDKIQKNIESIGSLPNLPPGVGIYLADELQKNLVLRPDSFSKAVFDGFYGDLRNGNEVVKTALEIELIRLGVKPRHLRVRVEETASEDFRLDTNISLLYNISELTAHEIGNRALMAVARLNVEIALMMTYSAISGLNESDVPLLRGTLGLIGSFVGSTNNEQQFMRVAQIAGLPLPNPGKDKLDVEKILKLRESDNCRAFRDWLKNTNDLSDREIKDRVAGMAATIKAAMGNTSTFGKILRFVVSNGLQLATSVLGSLPLAAGASVGISAIDAFIVDRIIPKDSIVSFLGREYPSVFKSNGK